MPSLTRNVALNINSSRMTVETEREADGRWLAEVLEIAGALCYGATCEQAIANAQALALRTIAERKEHSEVIPDSIG